MLVLHYAVARFQCRIKVFAVSTLFSVSMVSCTPDSGSFCSKYSSEKNVIVSRYLDSLSTAPHGNTIIKNYQLLMNVEEDLGIYLKPADYVYVNSSDQTHCLVLLHSLKSMESDEYMINQPKGKISSFVPMLTLDGHGKVTSTRALIFYDNGTVDTVSNSEVPDYNEFIEEKRLRIAKNKRERERLASKEEIQRKQRDLDKKRKAADEQEVQAQKTKARMEQEDRRQELRDLEENALPAERLFRSFTANQVSANRQFLNERLTIKGTVTSVREEFGVIYIILKGDDYVGSVSCATDDSENASRLRSGDYVVIKGVCMGLDPILSVHVNIEDSEILAY